MTVEFWFEFASTYSYPAAMRLESMAQAAGAQVSYRPFLLAPIFDQQGWNNSPFNIYEAKGRYMWRDLSRICADLQLPFRKPSVFPRSGLSAARIACAFAEAPWVAEFVRRVYTANFAEDREISDMAVLRQIVTELGQQPDAVVAASQAPELKERLRVQTEGAQRVGIFGAPSFRVDGELFWGNDRLEDALRWHRRAGSRSEH